MFRESATWYDRFYADKDYAGEARRIIEIIREHAPRARTLLDVACGTGLHLEHLHGAFECQGLDLDDGLLDVARRRLPAVRFTRGDMTCLFSSIGYADDVAKLNAAFQAMARHLDPGGVLVVEPWILLEAWDEDRHHAQVVEDDDATLVRVLTSRRIGSATDLFMHYAVARNGHITTADETHRLRLFTREEYLDAATAAGLTPTWDSDGLTGRGLLTGIRV